MDRWTDGLPGYQMGSLPLSKETTRTKERQMGAVYMYLACKTNWMAWRFCLSRVCKSLLSRL